MFQPTGRCWGQAHSSAPCRTRCAPERTGNYNTGHEAAARCPLRLAVCAGQLRVQSVLSVIPELRARARFSSPAPRQIPRSVAWGLFVVGGGAPCPVRLQGWGVGLWLPSHARRHPGSLPDLVGHPSHRRRGWCRYLAFRGCRRRGCSGLRRRLRAVTAVGGLLGEDDRRRRLPHRAGRPVPGKRPLALRAYCGITGGTLRATAALSRDSGAATP